jgi:cobalt-zinc-cadmium resistance protein CzcA
LGDVADVNLATELRTGAALVRGKEAVIGTTMMLMGENSRTVATRVAERLKEIQEGMPKGYKLVPLYNRADLVNFTIGTVEHNLMMGAFLVILILSLLIGNLRAAIITAIVIPLTLLGSFIAMKYFNISGNLMSLGALDFGIIVDGTVILLDHCVRVLQARSMAKGRSLTEEETREAVFESAVEMRTAAGFGQLIIVVVFLPIFALIGVEGKMFRPMATTFIIAILIALCFEFTLAPALASLLMRGKVEDKEPWIMRKLEQFYEPILSRLIQVRKQVALVGLVITILGVILFINLGGEFLPHLDEGTLLIQTTRPVTVSVDQSIRLQEKTELLTSKLLMTPWE